MNLRSICISVFVMAICVSTLTGAIIGLSLGRSLLTGLVFGSAGAITALILGLTGQINESIVSRHTLKINPLPGKRAIARGVGTVVAGGIVAGFYWEFSFVGWLLWIPTTIVLGLLGAWVLDGVQE
jgi:hypothetical protein